MSARISGLSLARRGCKIAVPALALMMAATLGLANSPAWARPNTQGEATLKLAGLDTAGSKSREPEAVSPERQQLIKALDQWMSQTRASYTYDIPSLQDPFLPIEAVRGDKPKGPEPSAFTQLKLVAITVSSDGSGTWALFEDGAGHGHILRPGDRFNDELVVSINASTVRVEDPVRGSDGRARITEIKLASPGSLAGLTRSEEKTPGQ